MCNYSDLPIYTIDFSDSREMLALSESLVMVAKFCPALLPARLVCRYILQKRIPFCHVRKQFNFGVRFSSNQSPLDNGEVAKDSPLDKIQDYTGGKIDETPEEGKLFVSERAKNLLVANKRFQLFSYMRLPDDLTDAQSVYSSPRHPIHGAFHKESCRPVLFLRPDNESENQHIVNVSKLSNASLMTGHIDPTPLIPVFTRVGLKPPSVLLVGDLLPVEKQSEVQHLLPESLKSSDARAYWFDWSSVQYVDLFDKKLVIKGRDFRAAFIDYLAQHQHQAIHLANTKYFDFLPTFCKGFLGVPVDDAYFYSVDRIGMSIFALRSETEDQWREYRFPFTK